jgi:signal transduction histidine kinase
VVAFGLSRKDALLPAGLFALGTLELALSGIPDWPWGVAILGVACALLVLRRIVPLVVAPLAAWTLSLAQFVEPGLSEPAMPIAVIVVACYSCARYRQDLWGIAAVGIMLLSAFPRYFSGEATNDITDIFFVSALLVPPFIFGRVARKLSEQTEQLKSQQALLQDQAVRQERDRIARELHDVIAHSISAMVVQTSAARDLVTTDPDRARVMLEAVAGAGRRTLAETARLLHLIRDDSDELGLQPVLGMFDLDRLAGSLDSTPTPVDLRVDGDLSGLPSVVDVCAYRIVQEAITNASRYGEGPVTVEVRRVDGAVHVRSSNRVAPDHTSQGGGLGLLGMVERASLLGGVLSHGMRGDRFEVEAVLPLGTS